MSLTFLPWLSLWTAKPPAHTHMFNGPFSGTTRVSQYQKGKTNLDFTEARESEWQWHQLGHMQVCTSLQTDNHASTPPLQSFSQARCPSWRPTNSVKALKAKALKAKALKAKALKAAVTTKIHTDGKMVRECLLVCTHRQMNLDFQSLIIILNLFRN